MHLYAMHTSKLGAMMGVGDTLERSILKLMTRLMATCYESV